MDELVIYNGVGVGWREGATVYWFQTTPQSVIDLLTKR